MEEKKIHIDDAIEKCRKMYLREGTLRLLDALEKLKKYREVLRERKGRGRADGQTHR